MHVLVSGSSGLLGSAIVELLTRDGHDVVRLVRRRARGPGEIGWEPERGTIDEASLGGLDAVVHLAGESIADSRWTAEKKRRIRESRTEGTRLLAQSLARADPPPKVLACASAIGYYGDRGDAALTEESGPGEGFLADVCRKWEAATGPAAAAGIRVVNMRLGLVLAREGGPLAAIVGLFRWGLGGKLGDGRQYMSWITIDDAVRAIRLALTDDRLSGPVNLTAPQPVTNVEFTAALGRVLHRPTLFRAPAFGLRLGMGEMAGELLLFSARVLPKRLQETGFEFQDPQLEPALQRLLN
ncbi:MAG: TIGR01777 family oxidoreductase [Planctomycetota bacterium]